MGKTAIEWTDKTWNPVTGCSKVSQGCKHCYAETIAGRFWAAQYPFNPDGSPRRFTDVRTHTDRLDEPLHWRKPARVFVNSMSDLWHEDVPDEFIMEVFSVMLRANWHTYQILTKRPKRMMEFLNGVTGYNAMRPGYNSHRKDHIWLGVSVENQQDERISLLLQTPAAVRFVSAEPLLGPLHLTDYLDRTYEYGDSRDLQPFPPALDWVIAGGESGPGARPMHPDWARGLRDQCVEAGVPFFFKQWGAWAPVAAQYGDDDLAFKLDMEAHSVCLGNKGTIYSEEQGSKQVYWCGYQPDPWENPWYLERTGKKASGRLLDGQEWNQFPGEIK